MAASVRSGKGRLAEGDGRSRGTGGRGGRVAEGATGRRAAQSVSTTRTRACFAPLQILKGVVFKSAGFQIFEG